MKSLIFSFLIFALNLHFAEKLLRKAKVADHNRDRPSVTVGSVFYKISLSLLLLEVKCYDRCSYFNSNNGNTNSEEDFSLKN